MLRRLLQEFLESLAASARPTQSRRRVRTWGVIAETLEPRQLLTTLVSRVNEEYLLVTEKVDINGTLYFAASDSQGHSGLWKSDGTPEGTVLVKRIDPIRDSHPGALTNVNGVVFFRAQDGIHGYELWKSDGTEEGTVMVKDINPETVTPIRNQTDSYPTDLINADGTLYFSAFDGTHGIELWKSDGTAEGTVLVKDINTAPSTSNPNYDLGSARPDYLQYVNGTLYFTAWDGIHGVELWKSDGTPDGTQMVKDIFPGEGSSGIKSLTNVNGTLYFSAKDGTTGEMLWTSDGTQAGTRMVKFLGRGLGGVDEIREVNGQIYFRFGEETEFSLWKTDGTEAGTIPVEIRDANRKVFGFEPRDLTAVHDTLFFVARDKKKNLGLWKIDAETGHSVLVKTFPLSTSSNFSLNHLTAFKGDLYFQSGVEDASSGVELWTSDGTESGTKLLQDINPGTANSFPGSFVIAGSNLFFDVNDGTPGRSLWRVAYINEAPTNVTLSKAYVAENNLPNSVVGSLQGVDPDRVDTFTFSLVNGTGDADNSSFTIAGHTLVIVTVTDLETQSSYSIRVRVTDQEGLSFEKSFMITVKQAPSLLMTAQKLTAALKKPNVLDNGALLHDADSQSFAGGSLTVVILQGGQATDWLSLNAKFNSSLGALKYTKGTLKLGKQLLATATGGSDWQPLVIQFQSGVTLQVAQEILRNVTFSSRTRGLRTIGLQISDETGLSSQTAVREVEIL